MPYALQNASHSAAVFRQATSAPFQTPGILGVGELAVTQQGTPNMSIILGAGRAVVAGSQVTPPAGLAFTTQAMYDVLNDGAITLTVTTANATNPRIDAVYVGVQDAFYSGSNNQALAGIVAGTPAASPVAPSVPANSQLVGYIAVGAGVTSIVTANISVPAPLAGLIDGVLHQPTLALLNKITGLPGQHATVYADPTSANNGPYMWSGSAWVTGITVVYSSGITAVSGYTTQLDRSQDGGIVTFNFGYANANTTTAGTGLVTIPAPFRPSNPLVVFTGSYNAMSVPVFYQLSSAGLLVAYPTSAIGAGANLFGSISYRGA